jgi:hypothetical protein
MSERNVTKQDRNATPSTNQEHDRQPRLHHVVEVARLGGDAGDVGDGA